MEFDFEIDLPNQFVDPLSKLCVPKDIYDTVFYSFRILILDSYRTYICLCFPPLAIAIACLLISTSYNNFVP